MSDSGRTPGDAEHHAELGRERAAVNAEPESTASELADWLEATAHDADDQRYLLVAKELRRLADENRRLKEDFDAMGRTMCDSESHNAQQQDRIAKLKAELTRRDEVLESMDQAAQWSVDRRLVTLKDVIKDNERIRNELKPPT